jgi:LPXTG-motif cell wall-anchored protein
MSTSNTPTHSNTPHLPITGGPKVIQMGTAKTSVQVSSTAKSTKHLPQTGTDVDNTVNTGLGFLGLAGLFGWLRRKKESK